MLSWFTAPLLEHLYIHDNNRHTFIHNPQSHERALTSLIQRSSCHIRRLAFKDCTAEEIRIVLKALPNIEELSVTHRSALDIIQDITPGLDGCIYLPKLQVLQVAYLARGYGIENAVTVFSRLLEAQGKGMPHPGHDIVPLEKFVVCLTLLGEVPDEVLEVMHGWPSFAQVCINGSVLKRLAPSLQSTPMAMQE